MEVLDHLDSEITIAAVGCHYGLDELMIHFTNEIEENMREKEKASASSSVKISGVSSPDTFLKKVQKALCVWLEDEQKRLSVTTSVLLEKAMPVKADLDTVPIQESSIHEPPFP
jgi:hypothetical protein